MEEGEQARIICAWCKDAKKKNPLATIGSTNLQVSAFARHEINPEHLLIADSHRNKKSKNLTFKSVYNFSVV